MYQSISGFPELTPAEQIAWNNIISVIRKHYEQVGAVPIETSAVERISVLEGKGSDDKEIYALRRLTAEEDEDNKVPLALRFDLTLPMARYVSEHENDLPFPFKRYQIQPVWRGERAQRGRYRQFCQCDIDVVGDGQLSLLNDAEMPFVIYKIFTELNIGDFIISINNRKILTGFFESIGFQEAQFSKAIKAIDNIDKHGIESAIQSLIELGAIAEKINDLLHFFQVQGDTDEKLKLLTTYKLNETFHEGVQELTQVITYLRALNLPESAFKIDFGIARGLDYYTGTVYETRLKAHPAIGSICSGGRYDHLLKKLGSRKNMPGVGISIGLSRLFSSLIDNNLILLPSPTVTEILITTMDTKYLQQYLEIASELRSEDINTEVYSENHKLSKQMKFANKKGIKFVVIAGQNEFKEQTLIVRKLSTGVEEIVKRDNIVSCMKNYIKPSL